MNSDQKIIIALQFWEGDKASCMKLARLIADLEPVRSNAADFMFSARYDTRHDEETIDYVSRKFNVIKFTSRRRVTGWPMGCNALWIATCEYLWHMQEAGKIPQYKAVLTFEGDASPLKRGWLEDLSSAWSAYHLDKKGKLAFMGDLIPLGPQGQHINGNCMVACDVPTLRKVVRITDGNTAIGGWDYINAPQFKLLGWQGTPLIRSFWNRREPFTDALYENLRNEGTVFFHGQKDFSLQDLVRQRLLSK